MPLPIIGLARAVAVAAIDTTVALVSLPARVIGLVGAAESLVERINDVVARAERLVAEAEVVAASAGVVVVDAGKISSQAAGVVAVAEQVSSQAAGVIAVVESTAAIANELIRVYEPIALRAAPLAGRFVTELSDEEVEAAIRLVDELPQLTEHLTTNILPILSTLDRVGPDVTELLKVTRDVRQAIIGIPGFGFFRRRGAERAVERRAEKEES